MIWDKIADCNDNDLNQLILSLKQIQEKIPDRHFVLISSLIISLNQVNDGNLQMLYYVSRFVKENIVNEIIKLLNDDGVQQVFLDYEISKLQMLAKFLPNILQVSKESIFFFPLAQELVNIKIIDDKLNIDKHLEKLTDAVLLGHAYTSKAGEYGTNIGRFLGMNANGLVYMLSKSKTREQAIKTLINPSIEHIQFSWGIIEKNLLIKNAINKMLPSIKTNKKIFIPRIFEVASQNNLLNTVPYDIQLQSLCESILRKRDKEQIVKIRLLSKNPCVFRDSIQKSQIAERLQQLHGLEKIGEKYDQIFFQDGKFYFCCQARKPIKIRKVVIHFHGGGFVAMSSFSHQTYTRVWANSLDEDSVIFSVDYRLAPQYSFPAGINDCWQSYLWIIHFAEFYFHMKIETIVLCGDSAGGNLALAVTLKAIQLKQRVPDGLLFQYPALVLDLQRFYPSFLKTFNDKIVAYSILMTCIKSYIPFAQDADKNILLCPSLCSVDLLQQLPEKIIIQSGSQDCLLDQSLEFVNRLNKVGKKPMLIIYQDFPHGFMNYTFPQFGIPQVKQIIDESCKIIRNFLY